jgi:hypothetical protein
MNGCPVSCSWGNSFNFSPFSMILTTILLYISFDVFRHVYANYFLAFFMVESWILSNFFCIYWDSHVIFVLHSTYVWCITVVGLHMLNHPYISVMKPYWSWCMIAHVLFNSVGKHFVYNFCICVHQRNWFIITILCVLIWFCYHCNNCFIEWVW